MYYVCLIYAGKYMICVCTCSREHIYVNVKKRRIFLPMTIFHLFTSHMFTQIKDKRIIFSTFLPSVCFSACTILPYLMLSIQHWSTDHVTTVFIFLLAAAETTCVQRLSSTSLPLSTPTTECLKTEILMLTAKSFCLALMTTFPNISCHVLKTWPCTRMERMERRG